MVNRALVVVACALVCALVCGCNLSPVSTSTGLDGGLPEAGTGGSDAGAGSQCPRALLVLDTDYASTNVSVLSTAGAVLSGSLISSGVKPPGLSAALSGDVILPFSTPLSGDLVLIDQKNDAIDWIDPTSAAVIAQISVATGFDADPTDYLEVAPGKAYVTRYDTNTTPGMQPFDAGGDVLILDATQHTVTGRIDLTNPDDGTLLPRAYRMLLVGGQVWVSLERLDVTYMTAGDERIAGIDPATDTRTFTLDLMGLENCGGLALSPSGKVVAVACGGSPTSTSDTAHSGLVTLDATKTPPVILERYPVATTFGGALAPTLAFASETLVVGVVYGDSSVMPARNDVGFTLDLTSGTATKLVDAGMPFKLGSVFCTPGCGDRCAMADAQANGVRFWQLTNGALVAQPTVAPDPSVGLPPVGLGAL
jgi:DNA-binding beta-propeller fold protein YncE